MPKPFKFPRHRRVSFSMHSRRGLRFIDVKVQEALKIIEDEFAGTLREKDVAKRLGVSTSYFRHLFKKMHRPKF